MPPEGACDDMPRLVSALLTPRGLVAFWLVFAASFILMLWLVSPGRTLQDALTAELLQRHLAGGYQLRNPPLYEWLLWAVQRLAGQGPLSYLVLRYGLIAATGILFYAAVRRTVSSHALAASFSLSLVLFYWFGWEAHHSVSHTLALLVAGLALWIAALVYADKPTALKALALGLVIGLGIMAKWSFLLLVFSLGMALAVVPSTRRIYADPRSLLVPAAAALPVLPYLVWLAQHDTGLIAGRSVLPKAAMTPKRVLEGTASFLTGLVLVFLPLDPGGGSLRAALSAGLATGTPHRDGDPARPHHCRRDRRAHGRELRRGDAPRHGAVRSLQVCHSLSLPGVPDRYARDLRPRRATGRSRLLCAASRRHLGDRRRRHLHHQAAARRAARGHPVPPPAQR